MWWPSSLARVARHPDTLLPVPIAASTGPNASQRHPSPPRDRQPLPRPRSKASHARRGAAGPRGSSDWRPLASSWSGAPGGSGHSGAGGPASLIPRPAKFTEVRLPCKRTNHRSLAIAVVQVAPGAFSTPVTISGHHKPSAGPPLPCTGQKPGLPPHRGRWTPPAQFTSSPAGLPGQGAPDQRAVVTALGLWSPSCVPRWKHVPPGDSEPLIPPRLNCGNGGSQGARWGDPPFCLLASRLVNSTETRSAPCKPAVHSAVASWLSTRQGPALAVWSLDVPWSGTRALLFRQSGVRGQGRGLALGPWGSCCHS